MGIACSVDREPVLNFLSAHVQLEFLHYDVDLYSSSISSYWKLYSEMGKAGLLKGSMLFFLMRT